MQIMNHLRSNLELALPGAVGLFTRLDSKITLAFLRRFPTAEKVAWLSVKRLDSWLASVGYTGGISAATTVPADHRRRPGPGRRGRTCRRPKRKLAYRRDSTRRS